MRNHEERDSGLTVISRIILKTSPLERLSRFPVNEESPGDRPRNATQRRLPNFRPRKGSARCGGNIGASRPRPDVNAGHNKRVGNADAGGDADAITKR